MPTFSWTAVTGATKYWLTIATSATALPTNVNATICTGTCTISTNVASTSFVPATALTSNTTYFWEIQAYDATISPTRQGLFSSQGSFTVSGTGPLLPAPSPLSPLNGAVGVSATPTFTWSPVIGATKYWLTVATSPGTLPTAVNSTTCSACTINVTIASATFAPATALSNSTTYYWEVQGYKDTVSPTQQGVFSAQNSFTTAQNTGTSDPGASSALQLVSGTINGQALSPSSRTVSVAPGTALIGSFVVQANSSFPSTSTVAMGLTPTWGTHSTSYTDLGTLPTPATGVQRSITVNATAPSTPGTYYLIAAFRSEPNAAQVMSATDSSYGSPVWGNGDDVADWSPTTIGIANADGTVQVSYLFPDGHHFLSVPATSLQVVVTAPAPVLTVTPSALTFQYQQAVAGLLPGKTVVVDSSATGTSVTATTATADGGNWLNLSTNTLSTPNSLNVFVASGLPPGAYRGSITLSASGMAPVLLPVTLSVSTVPTIADVAPPESWQLLGTLDPTLPTVVLTHGLQSIGFMVSGLWTGNCGDTTPCLQAKALIQGALKQPANVVYFVWEDAGQIGGPLGWVPVKSEYDTAKLYAHTAGMMLSTLLRTGLNRPGQDYDQPIHFIGHSLGTVVNTYAAQDFLKKETQVKYAQFTALDRPDHTSQIPCPQLTMGFVLTGVPKCSVEERDFDSMFFANNLFPQGKPLRDNLTLRIDNYYGDWKNSWSAVGDQALGAYNYGPLVNASQMSAEFGANDDHNGIQEWYRWTINPTSFAFPGAVTVTPLGSSVCGASNVWTDEPFGLDPSLNPCGSLDPAKDFGWRIAMESHADPVTFLTSGFPPLGIVAPPTAFPDGASINGVDTSGGCSSFQTSDSTPASILHFKCVKELMSGVPASLQQLGRDNAIRSVQATTTPTSPFAAMTITLPANAQYLSFTYQLGSSGSGDYLSVTLDNTPIWVLSGTSATPGSPEDSGLTPISGFAAGPHQLRVALHGVGPSDFSFDISNFQVTASAPSAAASIAATQGSGQTALIGAAFATVLQATVTDATGNAVPGVTVTFSAPASAASGTFAGGGTSATATTDASGVATSSTFTANGISGGYNVTASAVGVSNSATFSLTNLPGLALLGIAKTHSGAFRQGQNGATYSVTVSNSVGMGPTAGTVTVTETIPSGMTIASMAGSGWTCLAGGTACTRSDTLIGGSSYPPITVTVNVAANAAAQVTNQVTVTGGGSIGSTASDLTGVTASCTVTVSPTSPVVPGNASTLTLSLTNASCGWTAVSNAPWLTPAAASGTSNTLNIAVSANTTVTQRAGSLTVAGQTINVTQVAGSLTNPPMLVSLSPFQGTGVNANLTFVYSDSSGWAAIQSAEFIINPRWEPSGRAGGCYIKYAPATGIFTLIADDGIGVGGTTLAGSTVNISNSQCMLNAASSNAAGTGNNLTVVANLTFAPSFGGQRHIWMQASDYANQSTNWLVYGVWFPIQTSLTTPNWYRIYDPNSKSYLYSADQNEYNALGAEGFAQQGISGLTMSGPASVSGTSNLAFYRVFVNATNSHFWTSDRNEFLTLINQQQAYVGEGVATFIMPYLSPQGQVSPQVTNSIPFWRAAYQGANLHFWTSDPNEYNGINGKHLPPGYVGEGIASYVFPSAGAQLNSAADSLATIVPVSRGDDFPAVVSVVNSASYVSSGVVVPGQVLTVYGRNLGGSVLLNGEPARIISANNTAIHVLVPNDLSGASKVRVEVEHRGRRTKAITLNLVQADPAVFVDTVYGRGNAEARNEDGVSNDIHHAARRGSVVTIYATGVPIDGNLPVDAHIAGRPARILSIRRSTTREGAVEIQMQVPPAAEPAPFQPVVLRVGNLFSQPGAGLAIQ